jgi:hypothetical protein
MLFVFGNSHSSVLFWRFKVIFRTLPHAAQVAMCFLIRPIHVYAVRLCSTYAWGLQLFYSLRFFLNLTFHACQHSSLKTNTSILYAHSHTDIAGYAKQHVVRVTGTVNITEFRVYSVAFVTVYLSLFNESCEFWIFLGFYNSAVCKTQFSYCELQALYWSNEFIILLYNS